MSEPNGGSRPSPARKRASSAGNGAGATAAQRAGAEGTHAWLFTGEDPGLLATAVADLVNQLVGGAERSLVLEEFSADELDVAAAADACQTPPFLADRRVVVLREAERFNLDQLQPLLSYLAEPLTTTKLVVAGRVRSSSNRDVPGGTVPAKFVTAFKALPGTVVVMTDLAGREARGWVKERIDRAPVKLVPAAASTVEEHLGEDLSRLGALLATLEAAYGTGATVGLEELEPYLGRPGSVPPWDLTDAIDKGETEVALNMLHRMMEAGGRHSLAVLATLHRHFGNILRTQSPAITSETEAAAALGIAKGRSTFPARKALDAARRLGPSGSGDAIIALADAELDLKGRLDWEPEIVLEVLVARLCQISRRARGASPAGRSGGSRSRR